MHHWKFGICCDRDYMMFNQFQDISFILSEKKKKKRYFFHLLDHLLNNNSQILIEFIACCLKNNQNASEPHHLNVVDMLKQLYILYHTVVNVGHNKWDTNPFFLQSQTQRKNPVLCKLSFVVALFWNIFTPILISMRESFYSKLLTKSDWIC